MSLDPTSMLDDLDQVVKEIAKAVDVPPPTSRLPVASKIEAPHGKPPLGHALGQFPVAALMFPPPVHQDQCRSGLFRREM